MSESAVRLCVRVVMSLGLMGAGLLVLIADVGNSDLQKAAGGWVGLTVGYWLK
jgi:hypothetical protein